MRSMIPVNEVFVGHLNGYAGAVGSFLIVATI